MPGATGTDVHDGLSAIRTQYHGDVHDGSTDLRWTSQPRERHVFRDLGCDRENESDERDMFYDTWRHGRHHFGRNPYVLWGGNI